MTTAFADDSKNSDRADEYLAVYVIDYHAIVVSMIYAVSGGMAGRTDFFFRAESDHKIVKQRF